MSLFWVLFECWTEVLGITLTFRQKWLIAVALFWLTAVRNQSNWFLNLMEIMTTRFFIYKQHFLSNTSPKLAYSETKISENIEN